MSRITGWVVGLSLFAGLAGLAGCSAEVAGSESDDFDGELASSDVSEPGEIEQSININIGLLPTQCCILGYSDGAHACGQVKAIKAVAKRLCKDAAHDSDAASRQVKGGECSKYEECPNYDPPPVSTPVPPRPPGACPTNHRCCEPGLNGTCDRCVHRDLECQ